MATPALSGIGLPNEQELQSFARAAAHLLAERRLRSVGSRTVRRRAGVGIEHLDHREYVAGDDVRHIDWRQTARRRKPMLRRFESEAISDWTLLIDASSSMTMPGTAKWGAALRAAAAMSYALLELGDRVGTLAFGRGVVAECPRGRGRHHYAAIVRNLQALRPPRSGERSDLGACAVRLRGGGSVFAISDFLAEDEMRRDLAAVLDRCTSLHVLQLRDSAETRLSVAGDVELVDVETGARIPVRADERVTTAATGERTAMTRRLRSFCHRRAVAFTDWDVAEPWQQTLIRHLVQSRSIC